MGFRVLIVGGTGQVGSELVRALLAASSCTEVLMVNRRTIHLAADARLRQVIMDTGAANFASEIAELARTRLAKDGPLYAASCIGIGKGSQQWSEEDIKKLEIGLVGAFTRGCLAAGVERFGLLSAAGSSAKSWIRYARIMGEKAEAVRSLGFKRLAIFRPGDGSRLGHGAAWSARQGWGRDRPDRLLGRRAFPTSTKHGDVYRSLPVSGCPFIFQRLRASTRHAQNPFRRGSD